MKTQRYTVDAALEGVRHSEDKLYAVLLEHGSMELGFYKPIGSDEQQPHDQDEIYIVQSGSGEFVLGDDRQPVETGEALFVPAGVPHRFENFSADFAAWVVFYGATGGEAESC